MGLCDPAMTPPGYTPPEPKEQPKGYAEDCWNAARDFLLDLARQPKTIGVLAEAIDRIRAEAVMTYSHRRRQFDETMMSCGHQRRHWLVKEGSTAEQFVADTAAHGYCVVCKAVKKESDEWTEIRDAYAVRISELEGKIESLRLERMNVH